MRIAEVIGKMTLSKWHSHVTGATWILAVPLTRHGFGDGGQGRGRGEPIVVYDEMGANTGSLIAVSEGPEAAAAFQPDLKPIDAYNAAILDTVDIEQGDLSHG